MYFNNFRTNRSNSNHYATTLTQEEEYNRVPLLETKPNYRIKETNLRNIKNLYKRENNRKQRRQRNQNLLDLKQELFTKRKDDEGTSELFRNYERSELQKRNSEKRKITRKHYETNRNTKKRMRYEFEEDTDNG